MRISYPTLGLTRNTTQDARASGHIMLDAGILINLSCDTARKYCIAKFAFELDINAAVNKCTINKNMIQVLFANLKLLSVVSICT